MQLSGKQKACILLGILVLLLLAGRMLPVHREAPVTVTDVQIGDATEQQIEETVAAAPQASLVVHVAGAVQNPGVYTLQEGQRVEDAILVAGLTEDSDADALNRAELLMDGQKIVVPFKSDLTAPEQLQGADTRVSINEADLNELTALPGIGSVKAGAIIQYRTQHGRFRSVEEIRQVDGIGAGIYDQIKNLIKI